MKSEERKTMTIKNESGIKPLDFHVLLLMDEVDEKTSGGIYLPEDEKNKKKYSQIYGQIVDIGSNAFFEWIQTSDKIKTQYEIEREGAVTPDIGDRVAISSYAGKLMKGKDGREYRLCNDEDVSAIIDKEIS